MAETAALLREKAARCRRLSESIPNQNDPMVKALLAMSDELEAMANAMENPDERPANDNR
jgi:hypothetical protein